MKLLLKDKLLIILLLGALSLVYWQWFLPGPKVANDFPVSQTETLKSLMDFPRVWSEKYSEGLGEYSVFTLWSWPLSFTSGVLAKLGADFNLVERILLFAPFILIGSLGSLALGRRLKLSSPSRFILSFFYLANTYIVLLIDGGQLQIALAYGLFPLSYLAVEQSINGDLSKKILAGFAATALGFLDIRIIFILLIVVIIRYLYAVLVLKQESFLEESFKWIKSGVVIAAITLFLNAYWLLVLMKFPIGSETYAKLTQTPFTSLINLGHAILLLSPNWFKNTFGQMTPLKAEFFLLPLIVFFSLVLKRKNHQVGFWIMVALIAVFLTKGSAEPLSQAYPWLFSHIPGFSLFRDSTKFFFLTALSYAVLIAIVFDAILNKIRSVRIKGILTAVLLTYLLFLIRPVLLNQMTGTLSLPRFQAEYLTLDQVLKNDSTFSRVFWIPGTAPLSYSSGIHPIVEASRLVKSRPFEIGVLGAYERFNFLREAPFMGQIFDVSGIRYITYPFLDEKKSEVDHDSSVYYYTFLNQISHLFWVKGKVVGSKIPLIETKAHQDKFFIADNVWWVVGSDDIYNESTKSANLRLAKNALVFADEQPGLGNQVLKNPAMKIILNNKSHTDLAANFIDSQKLFFPAQILNKDPDQTGWWKKDASDLIDWREFLKNKYAIDNKDFNLGGGWAIAEGNLRLNIIPRNIKKNSVLLARVFESSRSGQLSFYQDGKIIGKLDTKKVGNSFHWIKVGEVFENDKPITVESRGEINIVNALSVLSAIEWEDYQKKARDLEKRVFTYSDNNLTINNPTVTYQEVTSTKYLISVKNLQKPAMLVFSDNYNRFWRLNGESPIPVYSLLNGFYIEKNGDYVLEFEPQKYIYAGLLVSGLTLLFSVFLLVINKFKNKYN